MMTLRCGLETHKGGDLETPKNLHFSSKLFVSSDTDPDMIRPRMGHAGMRRAFVESVCF
jgi:hypothetical protein